MDYLTPAEVNKTLWCHVFSVNYTNDCCGCHVNGKLVYVAVVVTTPNRAKDCTTKLKSCTADTEHATCKLCQACGKKLGFEW